MSPHPLAHSESVRDDDEPVAATGYDEARIDAEDRESVMLDEQVPLLGGEETLEEHEENAKDWDGRVWWRKPSVYFLLPAFVMSSLAFGGTGVPKLNIVLSLICRQYFRDQEERLGLPYSVPVPVGLDNKQCQIPEVHAQVSKFILYMSLIAGIISAFTAPRLGSISDRYGRRALMAISSMGLFAGEVAIVLATKYPDHFPYHFLLVSSVIEGLVGSFMLCMALVFSYGTDCTPPTTRGVAFAYLQGCMYLGVAVGPAFGGFLIEATGDVLSIFYVALTLHMIYLVYVLVVLPESLSKRRMELAREKHRESLTQAGIGAKHWLSHLNPVLLVRPLGILCPTGPGSSTRLRLNMILLACIDCIIFAVGMGGVAVILLYGERVFEWGNLESSLFLSIVNSAKVTMLFLILPVVMMLLRRGRPMTNRDAHHGIDKLDIRITQFAILIELLGYLLYAVAPTGVLFTVAGAIAALGSVGSSIVQSALTKSIPASQTGQLLGAMALLHSLVRVAAPTAFNLIYAGTVGTFPQTVFVALASTFTIAFVASWFVKPGIALKRDGGDGDRRSEFGSDGEQ